MLDSTPLWMIGLLKLQVETEFACVVMMAVRLASLLQVLTARAIVAVANALDVMGRDENINLPGIFLSDVGLAFGTLGFRRRIVTLIRAIKIGMRSGDFSTLESSSSTSDMRNL